ncbi:MAG: tetratricopeptide repeat protein [Polyangia bacterium]
MQCQKAKTLIVDFARGAVTEDDRAALDAHLVDCVDCRKQQRDWLLLARLGRQTPPGLSADSQRQMLSRLIRQAQTVAKTDSAAQPSPHRFWMMSVTALAAVFVLLFWRLDRNPQVTQTPQVSAPVQVFASTDGTIEMSGAHVAYLSGTALRIDDAQREVMLEKGEVDVDVSHAKLGTGARFRVRTARFVVEVFGTRFRVTPDTVVTLRGRVKVLSLDGKELATLGAGDRWQLSLATVSAVSSPIAPAVETKVEPLASSPTSPPRAAAETPVVHPPKPAPAPDGNRVVAVSVRQKIALARSALADGNLVLARQKIADAGKSDPSLSQRAALALLEADCLLSERKYPEAIAAYRTVSKQYPEDPSGETAAFALAQFLSERGSKDEARAALDAYLLRYPSGRFASEVQAKIQRQREEK